MWYIVNRRTKVIHKPHEWKPNAAACANSIALPYNATDIEVGVFKNHGYKMCKKCFGGARDSYGEARK